MLQKPAPLAHKIRRVSRRRPVEIAPLTLVSAEYSYTPELFVLLAFNQAIDISGIDPYEIEVMDGTHYETKYNGAGADPVMVGDSAVKVFLIDVSEWTTPGVKLTVSGSSGIVAVSGGEVWAGVSDLGMPFP